MPPGLFDPFWHQLTIHGHVPGALMFDPELSPELYRRAFLAHRNVKDAMARWESRVRVPVRPEPRSRARRLQRQRPGVFAADIGRQRMPVYVMDNSHAATEQPNYVANDHDVTITSDGKPVVRLSDLYLTQRVEVRRACTRAVAVGPARILYPGTTV